MTDIVIETLQRAYDSRNGRRAALLESIESSRKWQKKEEDEVRLLNAELARIGEAIHRQKEIDS